MNDPYLYENSTVLKNLLVITEEKELDIASDITAMEVIIKQEG